MRTHSEVCFAYLLGICQANRVDKHVLMIISSIDFLFHQLFETFMWLLEIFFCSLIITWLMSLIFENQQIGFYQIKNHVHSKGNNQ